MLGSGNQGSVAFTDSEFLVAWTSIAGNTPTREDIDVTALADTEAKFAPGGVTDFGTSTIAYRFDPSYDPTDPATPLPPIQGPAESITVTFPLQDASVAAKYVGTGYVNSMTLPTLENGVAMDGQLVVKWDGMTKPAYTPATP